MMCDGSSFSKGNMKPVALVRIVVMRKMAVTPGIDCDLNRPNKTTRPETIPIKLMTTCKTGTACKLRPSIMMCRTAGGVERNDRVMEFLQCRHGDDGARADRPAL